MRIQGRSNRSVFVYSELGHGTAFKIYLPKTDAAIVEPVASYAPREALGLLREHTGPVHLLLTDVVMPSMSGRDLVDIVRQSRPEIRVLFASGYTDDAVVRHGVIEYGVDFIQKPFGPKQLLGKVREVLDRQGHTA